jgi:hypothetical protein
MRAPPFAPVHKLHPLATGAAVLGLAFWLTLGAAPRHAAAQVPTTALTTEVMSKPPARAASAAARPASGASAAKQATATSPLWSELTPPQQQALQPLAATWPTISVAQKRKWLVISESYTKLGPDEQAKLHSRMTDWVALSPQQRVRARLNFAETKRLSPDDKKAKWEAYQALPPEEKQKLQAGAAAGVKPPTTAAAVKPVAPQKLANVPKTKPDAKPPRIAAAPGQVDHNTLLPQPAPRVAPAPSN